MIKEEFIDDVKRKGGYISTLDAYRLIHFYTEEFGYFDKPLGDIYYELIYMWLKLNDKLENMQYKTKICAKCKVEKSVTEYYTDRLRKDDLSRICKSCNKDYRLKYNMRKNEKK